MIVQIIASIAVVGLLYLIINRLIFNLKYINRGIINLAVAVVFGGVIFLAYYFDLKNNMYMNHYYYLMFFFASIAIGLVLFIIYLIKSFKIRGFRSSKVVKGPKENKYIYLVFVKGLDVYLDKNYKGVIVKIKDSDFHDEVIKATCKRIGAICSIDDARKIGEVILEDKINTVYHCYLVNLMDDLNNGEYIRVDKREITKINFTKLDKQIIFRTLLGEDFLIKIYKKEIGD